MAEHVILFQIGIALIVGGLFGLLLCWLCYLIYIFLSILLDFEQEDFDIKTIEDLWPKKNNKVLRIKKLRQDKLKFWSK